MLQTLSNCYEICYNPLNNSKSKQLYSIPRGQRFHDSKINCDKYYNLPEIKNNRATSFGYGTKTDFSKLAPITPGSVYKINTMFDNKHGYSFKLNREQVKCGAIPIGNKNPSPQHYRADKSYLSNISYTMRALTPKSDEKNTNRFSPGPGKYNDQLSLNPQGRYFNAKYRDTKYGGLINPEQRLSQTRLTPGPGQYQDKDTLSPDGLYRNSKYLSQSRTKFATTPRKPIRNISYGPGPGGYKLPSDFGQYGSSRAYSGANLSFEKSRRGSIKHNSSYLGDDFMKRSRSNLKKSLTQNFYASSLDNSFIKQEQIQISDKKQSNRRNNHTIKKVVI
ncbi:hypothetical protein ABPG74_018739 [Tetrahymena malaccensis]